MDDLPIRVQKTLTYFDDVLVTFTMGTLRFVFAYGVFAAFALAQTFNNGTFLGTVTDSSGAAVAGVNVHIVRTDQPLERDVITDEHGNFLAPQIPFGAYRLEFNKTGFQKVIHGDINLSAGQSLRIDAVMTVGSVSETVNVDSKVAQVDTATANVGSTIFGTQVQELALNTRSFTQLMTLQPGVNSTQAQQPGFGSNTSVPFSFNGSQTSSNNWTLDGGRNIDTYNGNNLSIVNLDAIAEVRIERNAYSAEYGRNSGGQVNVITKSGTNEIHGSLFEFFRNDKLDARNFFAASRPKNRYNNFGGTVGGPIVKNKMFFFLSNEYRRIYQNTGVRTGIVPTDAQIAGNFGNIPIKDPAGIPYPNNQIPQSQIDPNAVALIRTFYARPTPGFSQGNLNYTSSEPDGTKYRSALARFDYNISPNLQFFARWNIDSTRLLSPYGLFATSNVMPYVADSDQSHIMRLWNASLSWVVSPSKVNQLTVASYEPSLAISTSPNASRGRAPGLNIPTVYNSQTDSSGFIPSLTLANGYAPIAINWPQNIGGYTYEIIDNFSWVKGRHTIKIGGSIDMEEKAQNNSNPNNNGTFNFNGGVTGDSLADFLIGRAFQYQENSAHVFGRSRWTNYSLYAQDQFRATNRLSLTFGLRWEFFQPEKDNDGLFSIFLPQLFDRSKAAVVLPSNGQIVTGTENYGNGLAISGTPQNPFGNAAFNSTYNTFAPRVGFSYAVNKASTTVVRGGFGMFHDRWSQFVSSLRNNYPFNQNAQIFSTELSNPGLGERRLFPIGLTNFTSLWNIPYLMKWSLGVQHQLPAELLLDVSYVGSRGVALLRTRDINQPVANARTENVNFLRPYPGFGAITSYETSGLSNYHSLQASLTRRFSNGFSFQGSYTWSRTIDNAVTPLNSYAANAMERAVSSFDRTHVAVFSYVYELPFAKNATGLTKHLLQGWQISGINSFQSGNPLTITVPGDPARVGISNQQRPDIIAPITMDETQTRWFSTSSFATPAAGTFGNAGRGILRGPGINNWDVSFSKRTQIYERLMLQFRAEFFNLLNHTQWANVGTSFGAATFGQVTTARDPRITQLGLRLLF